MESNENKDLATENEVKDVNEEFNPIQQRQEEQEQDKEELIQLIKSKQVDKLREFVKDHSPIDIAFYINDFEDEIDVVFLFKVIKSEYSAEIFSYLDQDQKEKIVLAFSNKEIQQLIDEIATDDLVDFVEELPSNLVSKVIQNASPDDRKEINSFLNYKEDTAGSIMTTEYVELKENITCKTALKRIKEVGKDAETIYTTFIIDSSRKLIGALYLDDLIFADEKATVNEIMNEDYIFVEADHDQEDIARLMKKYDITVIPVVNKENRMLGIITVDDIMDVIEQEQTEDLQKMAAVTPTDGDYLKTSCFKLAKARIPWLLFLMLSATLTGLILNVFESALQVLPVLTLFIPMLMDTGGNAGGQTTTIVTRAIALNQVTTRDYFRVLWKEFRIALIAGFCVAIVNFGWIYIELHYGIFQFNPIDNANNSDWLIAILIALTSYSVIILSKTIGACLPIFAKLVHLDPAIMAGPLVTTIVDATSLAIYLLLSKIILTGL